MPFASKPVVANFLASVASIKKRLVYALIIFITICVLIALGEGPERFFRDLSYDFEGFIGAASIIVTLAFTFLTLINIIFNEILPQWSSSKKIRLFVFASINWVVLSLIVIFIFNPYDHSSLVNMRDSEWVSLLLSVFAPPILVGFSVRIYNRYIQ